MILLLLLFGFVTVFALPAPPKYQLIYLQAVWRHGDRTPQRALKNDPIKESTWQEKYGIGFGELTPLGVKQHVKLGRAIRRRYIEQDFQFLPEAYNSSVMHIRSTDIDRTFKSGEANIIGMYPNDHNFTLHRVEGIKRDCAGAIFCKCPRLEKLLLLSKNLEENRKLVHNPEIDKVLRELSHIYGEPITMDNVWMVFDNLNCQRIHFSKKLGEEKWYSEELFERVLNVSFESNQRYFGLYEKENSTIWKGLNIAKEVKKLRIGSLIGEITERLQKRLENPTEPMRYHAYSAHDATVFALLTAFNLQNQAASSPGEWPHYSAAAFIELYLDQHNQPYFKLIYRKNENADFDDLTREISYCAGRDYCPFSVVKKLAKLYKFDEPVLEYCQRLP